MNKREDNAAQKNGSQGTIFLCTVICCNQIALGVAANANIKVDISAMSSTHTAIILTSFLRFLSALRLRSFAMRASLFFAIIKNKF